MSAVYSRMWSPLYVFLLSGVTVQQRRRSDRKALLDEFSEDTRGFHKKAFETDGFPWSADQSVRQSLLQEKWIRKLPMKEYAEEAYRKLCGNTDTGTEDSPVEKRRRRDCVSEFEMVL